MSGQSLPETMTPRRLSRRIKIAWIILFALGAGLFVLTSIGGVAVFAGFCIGVLVVVALLVLTELEEARR